ncbi:DUF7310 family coiled-coil domain-containing protein [Halovenus halobia]|uniref:DUF7310 family coiled-coil domain-containing protein n=1 Tax=Halovenus halobia TaxID=3396622 RepID=UPI003F569EE7
MDDSLRERVEALERTVADGEFDGGGDTAAHDERLSDLESRLDTVESTLDDLEAATQALRGYVGNVRSVNDEVEQRADTALAKVRALEDELDESTANTAQSESTPQPPDHQNTPHTQPVDPTDRSGRPAHQQTSAAKETNERRCQPCGHVHSENTAETDGGATHQPPENRSSENALVPDESEETGRLQRIRELL